MNDPALWLRRPRTARGAASLPEDQRPALADLRALRRALVIADRRRPVGVVAPVEVG